MNLTNIIIPITAISLASCANPSHLLVYQHSNLGVNAGISPATNNLHVRVGLRREFATIVPKYKEFVDGLDENGNMKKMESKDAASAYVAGRMRVRSAFETPEITECIASGKAAENVAGGSGLPHFITDLKPASQP